MPPLYPVSKDSQYERSRPASGRSVFGTPSGPLARGLPFRPTPCGLRRAPHERSGPDAERPPSTTSAAGWRRPGREGQLAECGCEYGHAPTGGSPRDGRRGRGILTGRTGAYALALPCRTARKIIVARLVSEPGELDPATSSVRASCDALRARGVAAFTSGRAGEGPRATRDRTGRRPPTRRSPEQADRDREARRRPRGDPRGRAMRRPARAASSRVEGPILVPVGEGENEWAAVEIAAWIASTQDVPLVLVGTADDEEAGRRDASRVLAHASLAIQRGRPRRKLGTSKRSFAPSRPVEGDSPDAPPQDCRPPGDTTSEPAQRRPAARARRPPPLTRRSPPLAPSGRRRACAARRPPHARQAVAGARVGLGARVVPERARKALPDVSGPNGVCERSSPHAERHVVRSSEADGKNRQPC
jgi:hypothetical protein